MGHLQDATRLSSLLNALHQEHAVAAVLMGMVHTHVSVINQERLNLLEVVGAQLTNKTH